MGAFVLKNPHRTAHYIHLYLHLYLRTLALSLYMYIFVSLIHLFVCSNLCLSMKPLQK